MKPYLHEQCPKSCCRPMSPQLAAANNIPERCLGCISNSKWRFLFLITGTAAHRHASWSPGTCFLVSWCQGNTQIFLCPNLFPNFSQRINPGGRFAKLVLGNSCLGKPSSLLLEKVAWLIILIAHLDWGRLPVVRLRAVVKWKIWRAGIVALRRQHHQAANLLPAGK